MLSEGAFFFDPRLPVYTDGACSTSLFRQAARAGWGCVQFRGDVPYRRAFGPVWQPMIQSAPAAEWMAWLMAIKLGARSCIKSDNKHVVDWNVQSDSMAATGNAVHAGSIRESLRSLRGLPRPTVEKVVGHAREKGIAIPLPDALGNEAADEAAGMGRDLHPQPTAKQTQDLDRLWARALLVCQLASKVLSLWLRPHRLDFALPRFRRLRPHREVPLAEQHHWCYAWGKWQCTVCARMCRHPLPPAARRSRCSGDNKVIQRILSNPQGHHLCGFTISGQTFLICLRCGAWSNMRAKLLDVRCCKAPATSGKTALGMVRRGLYPHSDARFSELRIEAMFPLVSGVGDPIRAGYWAHGPALGKADLDAIDH